MNVIDLNAYGVQEMTYQEVIETNGGTCECGCEGNMISRMGKTIGSAIRSTAQAAYNALQNFGTSYYTTFHR